MPGLSSNNAEAGPSSGNNKRPVSSHFRTLDREHAFRYPSSEGAKYPAPQQLVAPHIDSFDALFEGAPIGPNGQTDHSRGLLDLAMGDLQPKVVFDGKGAEEGALGNRLERECVHALLKSNAF